MLVHTRLLITTLQDQLDLILAQEHHIHLVTTLEHTRTPQLRLMSQQER
jgi:hypothetical protein